MKRAIASVGLVIAIAFASASPLPAVVPVYRAVALARNGDRVVLAGGGVLAVAPDCACATDVAGRSVAISLDDDGRIVVLRTLRLDDAALRSASEIPTRAYVYKPAVAGGDPVNLVTVTIVAAVPARTPSSDDVYLSTDRNGWRPAELRMNRVDALHWGVTLFLPRGARLAYRITRGSFETAERDAAKQLPPPHVLMAEAGVTATVTVANWGDLD